MTITGLLPWDTGIEYDEKFEVVKKKIVYHKETRIPNYIPLAIRYISSHPGCTIDEVAAGIKLRYKSSSLMASLGHNRLVYLDDNKLYLYDYEID